MKKTLEQRFWEKVNKSAPNGCWEWTASLNQRGYGMFANCKDGQLAHRISLIWSGKDLTGKMACHHCDNPKCVNPSHLFVGDAKSNMLDKVNKNRHHNIKIRRFTKEEIESIRNSRFWTRETYSSLGRKYHVNATTIRDIVLKNSYKDIK